MRYKMGWVSGLLLAVGVVSTAHAERLDHFKGLPAETLEEAVSNLSEYNRKLGAILAADDLSVADMAEIHELTYTLENALERINEELAELAEILEEVHVASETGDFDAALHRGREYLDISRKIVE